jgi:predicted PurR-regulated permease PerM
MGAGALSLIPFAGPVISFFAAFILALQQPASASKEGLDLLAALWRTGLVFGLAEVFEGYYLTPKILGESLGLHPVVVLVSIFAGGAAFGMFGILLALPVTAALVILFRVFVLPAMERLADE